MVEISVDNCVGGRDVTQPGLHPSGSAIVYGLADADAATLIWHPLDGGSPRPLTTEPAPRLPRGLGGGAWCWSADATSIFYAAREGNVWMQPVAVGSPRRLTDHGPDRAAAGLVASPDGRCVYYVVDQAEVWSVDLASGTSARVDDGTTDFVFDPAVSPDSAVVAWQAWSVPDMPWDAAEVRWCRPADGIGGRWLVDGAMQQPRFHPDGRPMYVTDGDGWLNVTIDGVPIVAEAAEHAGPSWGIGQRSFVASPDGASVAFTRNETGFGRLCVVSLDTGVVREVGRGVHGQLTWAGTRLAALRSGAKTLPSVVVYDTISWERSTVVVGPTALWRPASLAEPEPVVVPATDGTSLHGRLYRADHPGRGLLVWLHGGPTDQWQVTFMPRLAYWRSRGWNVLVPDHRGSTGHGRAYQQALRGRWGELDVSDVCDMVDAAHRLGWGTANDTVVIGGSAGGFTALSAAARCADAVAAVVVSYPVTDLADLAERSHRFERHYTDSLVGPLPASAELYRRRSPVWFTDRLTSLPILVMHGDVDPVVPVQQSMVFAQRCNAAGGNVQLHVYAGEGHGFRQPEHQRDEYERIGAFLERWVPAQ